MLCRKGRWSQKKQCYWPHWRQNSHFWPYYGQIWPNMGLNTILSEDNFTSRFRVKRVVIRKKQSYWPILDKSGYFWPYYGQIWPNMGLITIVCARYYFYRARLCVARSLYKPILGKRWCRFHKSSITDVAHEKITVLATFLPNMNCP